MLSTKLKEAAGNSADATLYVDDVFSTYLYTGNSSTQTITNGIDLAGKGGMTWIKNRTTGPGSHHAVFDTNRLISGIAQRNLNTDEAVGEQTLTGSAIEFLNTGWKFNSASNTNTATNLSGNDYVNWTFRKAAKFFDVVTYTGTGSAITIAHSLGVAPGMVIVKRTNTTGNWQVYHRSLTSAAYSIQLNLTNAQASAPTVWNSTAPTSSVFSVGTDATVNASGGTYVAYLFAHDTSSTGIIQCGSFTTDGSGNATVTLGWEPQFVLSKSSSAVTNWVVTDTMRGMSANTTGTDAVLIPNSNQSETQASDGFAPNATGFTAWGWAASATYIYMAIRRPNKPPTSGTQVYNPVLYSGVGTNNRPIVGTFPCDLFIDCNRTGALGPCFFDRLRSNLYLRSYDTATENGNTAQIPSNTFNYDQTSILVSADEFNTSGRTYVNYFLKRAPGFFDVVCYTGVGAADVKSHNLGVVPELMIVKNRSNAYGWYVFATAANKTLILNTTSADQGPTSGLLQSYTSTTFKWVDTSLVVNGGTMTYVAYLFATLAGISKVGSYTGNGTSQNIDCGFAAGARFFLVKATSTTGSWWVWDSARGITAGNDPALQLNSTAAEITTADAVDPYSPGITVNQEATCSINASGVSYIFLAVA